MKYHLHVIGDNLSSNKLLTDKRKYSIIVYHFLWLYNLICIQNVVKWTPGHVLWGVMMLPNPNTSGWLHWEESLSAEDHLLLETSSSLLHTASNVNSN